MADQTKRRLIGWRVRWEHLTHRQQWEPGQDALTAQPYARLQAVLLRGRKGEYRNVRVVRVYRRAK